MGSSAGTYKLRKELPTQYYAAIGRVITRWSIIEYFLERLTWAALGVGEKQGRISVRNLVVGERITLIKNLLKMAGTSVKVDWAGLETELKEMAYMRNGLAHSLWIDHPGSAHPTLQSRSGYVLGLPPGSRLKINPLSVELPVVAPV